MDLEMNSAIGDYQVLDILAGAAGKAYKVRNASTGQVAAMRVLVPDVAQAPGLSQQWTAAVRPLAALRHPNIASVAGVVEADNRLLLLTEFVEGVNLDQKVGAEPLAVAQAVDAIRQALAALDCAHGSGIIHGGVTPSKIIITPAGMVKLTGFGAAAPNAAGATSPYQAPEVIAGGAPDARSDIYAAAACLFRAVTGKQPAAVIVADPQLPPLLNQLISMAAAQDPAARFKSAAALGNALRSFAPTTPAEPAAATPVTPAAPVAVAAPAAPVAAAAAAEPVANPAEAPRIIQPAQPETVRGRRGLWMALGAVAAIALIVAAIEFVPWKGTKAAPPQAQPAQSAPAVATPESQPPLPAAPAAAETPVSPAQPAQPQSRPAAGQTVSRAPVPSAARRAAPPTAAAAVPQPVQEPAHAAGTAQPPPEPPAPSAAQLAEAREHYAMLNARASGIRTSLQTMRNSMAAHGMNLRGNIQTADTMMNTYMRSANDALSAGDLAQAGSQMEKAERQIEILEKFLNR